jgi:hypothetical protein
VRPCGFCFTEIVNPPHNHTIMVHYMPSVTRFEWTMGAERTTTAAAAGVERDGEIEPFEQWASVHRRRATRDGAWKVEVTERLSGGTVIRSVASWHSNAKQPDTPLRRAKERGSEESSRPGMQQAACAPHPQRQTARQRRSALRSAAHHRKVRLRLLSHLLAVRFLVRLSRLTETAHSLRDAPSPGKRRHSPPPTTTGFNGDMVDAALPPPPKRLEVVWRKRALSFMGLGNS